MTVRLQTPFAGQAVGTLYTGASEAALVASGQASLLPTVAAGVGPAAPSAAVRLSSPFGGQGVGTFYLGPNGADAVTGGYGYYEGTVSAGTPGGTVLPTLTLTGPLTYATNAAAGTLVANIGNVPAGVTPTLTPNDGRLVIAGSAGAWTVVTGLSAATAGTITLAVAAAGANGASVGVTVTAVVATYRQLVSSRATLAGLEADRPTPNDATVSDSRLSYVARGPLNAFQFYAVTQAVPINSGGEGVSQATTYTGMIEYPAGTFYNITWAGAASQLVPQDARRVSDVTTLPADIPSGATYWVWCRIVGVSSGLPIIYSAANGDSFASYNTTPPAFGTLPAGTGGAGGFAAITALHTTQRRKFALIGDSNMVPQQLSAIRDADKVSGFSTGLTNLGNVDHVKLAASGVSHSSANSRRIGFMAQLGVTDAIILLGTNNLSKTVDNTAAILGFDDDWATKCAAVGIKVHYMTLPPFDQSSGFQEPTRLAVNANRRSRSGTSNFGAYFDLADVVETARDSGVWKTNYTADNTHINWQNATGKTAILNAFSAWAATL